MLVLCEIIQKNKIREDMINSHTNQEPFPFVALIPESQGVSIYPKIP